MKPRLVLQTHILHCWISIAIGYNKERLERMADELTELFMFRIIQESSTSKGVITKKVIRRWMPAEQ